MRASRTSGVSRLAIGGRLSSFTMRSAVFTLPAMSCAVTLRVSSVVVSGKVEASKKTSYTLVSPCLFIVRSMSPTRSTTVAASTPTGSLMFASTRVRPPTRTPLSGSVISMVGPSTSTIKL